MVWGLKLSSGFGDFFPEGEFEGWHERLVRYYEDEMTDTQRQECNNCFPDYEYSVAQKFVYEIGEMESHEWPVEYQTAKSYRDLGSLIVLTNRLLAVDIELKNVIEKLEPKVHQFSPIKLTMPKKTAYPKAYFALVIRQFHNSFSPEHSDEKAFWSEPMNGKNFYAAARSNKQTYENLAMDRSVFDKAHLWRERDLSDPDIFISDAFHTAIAEQGLRVPKAYKLKEV